jgi:monoterpene epsilon-lactone hydrolase
MVMPKTHMMRYRTARIIIRLFIRMLMPGDFKARRKWQERAATKFIRLPKQVTVTAVDAAGVQAEWIEWKGKDSARYILYLHGGGYVICSPRTHRDLVWRIARSSCARALLIDYRLAPEHPHPAAVEDALTAYRWLLESGVDPSRIAVMGDSAGGGLALVLIQQARRLHLPPPACAVCLSPWADLTCSGNSLRINSGKDPVIPSQAVPVFARLYLPEGDLAVPTASPLFGDFTDFPPVLIHAGTDEVLLDDARRVAEKISQAGAFVDLKIWPDMIHVFQALAFMLPEARNAIKEIGFFVKSRIP